MRVSWAEAVEMIAAAQVHTIKTYGPDRISALLTDSGDVDGLATASARVSPSSSAE